MNTTTNTRGVSEAMVERAERGWYSHIGAHGLDGSAFRDRLRAALEAVLSAPEPAAQGEADAPSIEAAEAMGAKGGPAVEAERLAFEAWMKGHCWTLNATWRDGAYRSDAEQDGKLCPHAMQTRGLWAAWRDRAALAAPPAQPAERVPDVFANLYVAASKGFHTSETCGPESLYLHKSKFPTLQDLFDFEDAWRKAMLTASPAPAEGGKEGCGE